MGRMNLDPVESQRGGQFRAFGEGGEDLVHIFVSHGLAVGLVGLNQTGWAQGGRFREGANAFGTHGALMPKLQKHVPAGGFDRFHHPLPTFRGGRGQPGVTVVPRGGWVIDGGTFSDHQTHAALDALPVILGHVGSGHAFGGKTSLHGRHDESVGQHEPANANGLKQRRDVHIGTRAASR